MMGKNRVENIWPTALEPCLISAMAIRILWEKQQQLMEMSARYEYCFYLSEKDEDHEDYDEEDAKDDCESQPGVPEF